MMYCSGGSFEELCKSLSVRKLQGVLTNVSDSGGSTGGGRLEGFVPPPQSSKVGKNRQRKNAIKLVGYTFRLKNYVKIPSPPPYFFWIFQSWLRHWYQTGSTIPGEPENYPCRKFRTQRMMDKNSSTQNRCISDQ